MSIEFGRVVGRQHGHLGAVGVGEVAKSRLILDSSEPVDLLNALEQSDPEGCVLCLGVIGWGGISDQW